MDITLKKIQAIRGMNDLLPNESPQWQYLEREVIALFQAYGYREIRFPLLEQTALFHRGIGESTDIVEKEMYTFLDRNDESLTLRPEGTASCVRACTEHNMLFDRGQLTQKLWYSGPMFRYEKPQKGRLRQFHQFGVEAFGFNGPDIDAELLLLSARLWKKLGIAEGANLHINCLGNSAERLAHRQALIAFLERFENDLDDDSRRRLHKNPLRIFDSKEAKTQSLLAEAPALSQFLGAESRAHYEGLKAILDAAALPYIENPRLVRGLDYYNLTVFEWVTERLGSQGTICGGGRYDSLVQQLGGQASPAVGFGMGIERLILLMQEMKAFPADISEHLDVYIVVVEECFNAGVRLSESLRDQLPFLRMQLHNGGGSFRSQIKKADKSGARLALILGENEVTNEEVVVKFLRENREQISTSQADIKSILQQEFKRG